jgi:hypothetical protein
MARGSVFSRIAVAKVMASEGTNVTVQPRTTPRGSGRGQIQAHTFLFCPDAVYNISWTAFAVPAPLSIMHEVRSCRSVSGPQIRAILCPVIFSTLYPNRFCIPISLTKIGNRLVIDTIIVVPSINLDIARYGQPEVQCPQRFVDVSDKRILTGKECTSWQVRAHMKTF